MARLISVSCDIAELDIESLNLGFTVSCTIGELGPTVHTAGPRRRLRILQRDGFRCQICGRSEEEGAKLEIDHIIPYSKGGLTNDTNLQTLCLRCNRRKGKHTE